MILPRPVSRLRRMLGVVLPALAVTACTGGADGTAGQDDGAQEEMLNESIAEWDDYEQVSATELEFHLMAGNPSCFGVRTVVEETRTEVQVATIQGTKPEAQDQACTLELRSTTVTVQLQDELDDREVTTLEQDDVDLNR